MGFFRFFLAALVAYSHFGLHLPVNLGVSAVICFYFISGYLISQSYNRFKQKSVNPKTSFYIDRIIRLYPAYILVFFATLVFNNFDKDSQYSIFKLVYWSTPFSELTIIFNNYSLITNLVSSGVVPPSWSLGTEVQFYILLPFLMMLSVHLRVALLFLMIVLQFSVFFASGSLNDYFPTCSDFSYLKCGREFSDLFGYRFLTFVLAIFLLGNIAYECHVKNSIPKKIFSSAIAIYYAGFFLIYPYAGEISNQMLFEIFIGVMLLVPFSTLILINMQTSNVVSVYDTVLGKLAYPLFLTHFLAYGVAGDVFGDRDVNNFIYAQAFVISVLLSFIVLLFQEAIDRARYKYRGFGKVSLSSTS